MSDRFIDRAHHLAEEMRVQTTPADRDPVLMAVADGLETTAEEREESAKNLASVGCSHHLKARLLRDIDRLLSERHRAEEAKWLPMDSAPKDRRILLKVRPRAHLGDDTEVVEIGYWLDNTGTRFPWSGWHPYAQPTGWMPLPLTPEPTHER